MEEGGYVDAISFPRKYKYNMSKQNEIKPSAIPIMHAPVYQLSSEKRIIRNSYFLNSQCIQLFIKYKDWHAYVE